MSEKSTLEDVRIISLEGQVALQKIELEKLSSNLEEHRWDAAAIHHCFLYSQSTKNEIEQLSVVSNEDFTIMDNAPRPTKATST